MAQEWRWRRGRGFGHEVEPAEPGHDRKHLLETFMTLFAAHSAPTIEALAAAVGRTPGPDNLERNNLYLMERSRSLSASDLLRALYDIKGITRAFARFFEDYDIWLTPTTACPSVSNWARVRAARTCC